jgi:cation diffusion facilitator family transporter
MESHTDHRHSIEAGRNVTLAGMGINALLITLKILGGVYGNSKALLADAVHSISDFLSDVIVLVGLHFFHKEKDLDHPYGHGKIETLATIGIGVLLLLAAIRIGIEAALTIRRADIAAPHRLTILVAAFSIASKEILYHVTVRIGRRIKSEAMKANAWHHRSDAWSSAVTLVGVTLAVFVPRLRVLDSYSALFVSFFIIKIAFDILRDSIKKIIDTAPSPELIQEMCDEAVKTPGVMACHDLTARYYADRIIMEIHVEVEPSMTVLESHAIAHQVSGRLKRQFEEIENVTVHIDPYEGSQS